MPKVRFATRTQLENKAMGLKPADAYSYANMGEEKTVSDEALKWLEKTHPGLFEVVGASRKATAKKAGE